MENSNQTKRLSFQDEIYANSFKKEFHIMDSPQIIDRICEIKQSQYKDKKEGCKQFKMQSLLKMNRGRSVKRISENREKFIEIKRKLGTSIELINKNKQELTLSQIFLWKQSILTNFLQQFIEEISKQCAEKSDILQYIWNSTFNLIEYLIGVIAKINKNQQKRYLSNILSNHTSYQQIIQNLTQKLEKKKNQMEQQQDFIKSLVYNLRFKRKQIKKLTKNLKLCTVKVNQIKNFYLDLQQQHIDLLSEIRDISKENASNLIKRKQQINHEKRKQYKLKTTTKKLRFQIQKQINNQNISQKVNVQKLHDELKSSFNKYYLEKRLNAKKGSSHSITQNIFESAMDDFNIRVEEVPGTEELLNFKTNIGFVDIMTDMDDFIRDEEEKQVQTTFIDKFTNDMISNKAVQTIEVKPKLIKYKQVGIQVNQTELKGLKLSKRKVIDCSFLLSDYRNKNAVLQKGMLKLQLNPKFLNFLKENHLNINYQAKQQKQIKQQTHPSFAAQTNQVFLYDFNSPLFYKNQKLEQQILRYLQQIKVKSVTLKNQQSNEFAEAKYNFKSKKWVKGIKNRTQNSTFHDFSSRTNDIFKKSDNLSSENNQLKSERSAKIFASNNKRVSKSGQLLHRSSSNMNGQQMKEKNRKKQFQTINETSYEQLTSNQKGNTKKFWINKSGNKQLLSLQKKKLLNDLGRSSQLFNKVSELGFALNGQNLYQDKKILQQLDEITEAFQTNQQLLESLKTHIHSNINILQQQLKKMLQTKKINRILAQSQRQRLSKIISLVITYAYHLYFNRKMSINNLIIPLFHYFKIGYGEIKKNDLYLRMLYFLSQTICHQDQYYIFETFILFLGLNLNQKQTKKIKINKQNTCLFLRLLNGLSVNFKFPLNVEILYTTIGHAQKKCRQILTQEHYESNIIDKVIERVKGKLNTLVSNNQSSIEKVTQNQEYCQIKVNVFKCCQFIIQEIQKIRSMVYDSYFNIYEYFTTIDNLNEQEFVKYILKNMYLQRIQYQSKLKKINVQLSEVQNEKGLQKFIKIFISANVPDFNKIYFLALSKFKIKEEFLYLSINRRLSFLMKYIEIHQQDLIHQHRLIKHIIHRQQASILKELTNKKILALIYLQSVQYQAHTLLNSIIGTDLNQLYELSSICTQ